MNKIHILGQYKFELEKIKDQFLREAMRAAVRDEVIQLPKLERLVIYLFFWESFNYVQIAQKLGISKKSVESIAGRALRRLKSNLSFLNPNIEQIQHNLNGEVL